MDSDKVGGWEVKLQLLERPLWPSPKWPALGIHGVKDTVCRELGFLDRPLGHSFWRPEPLDITTDVMESDDKKGQPFTETFFK